MPVLTVTLTEDDKHTKVDVCISQATFHGLTLGQFVDCYAMPAAKKLANKRAEMVKRDAEAQREAFRAI